MLLWQTTGKKRIRMERKRDMSCLQQWGCCIHQLLQEEDAWIHKNSLTSTGMSQVYTWSTFIYDQLLHISSQKQTYLYYLLLFFVILSDLLLFLTVTRYNRLWLLCTWASKDKDRWSHSSLNIHFILTTSQVQFYIRPRFRREGNISHNHS